MWRIESGEYQITIRNETIGVLIRKWLWRLEIKMWLIRVATSIIRRSTNNQRLWNLIKEWLWRVKSKTRNEIKEITIRFGVNETIKERLSH